MTLHRGKTYSIESLNIELPACFKLRYNTIKKQCGTLGKVKMALETSNIFGEKSDNVLFQAKQFGKRKDSVSCFPFRK